MAISSIQAEACYNAEIWDYCPHSYDSLRAAFGGCSLARLKRAQSSVSLTLDSFPPGEAKGPYRQLLMLAVMSRTLFLVVVSPDLRAASTLRMQ